LREGDEELIVRAVNEFQTVEEIGEIIISRRGEVPVRLNDLATVRRHYKERKTVTRINGRESVEIALFKEADANTVTVARAIKERLGDIGTQRLEEEDVDETGPPSGDGQEDAAADGIEPTGPTIADGRRTVVSTLPDGVSLYIVSDQSRFIENAIDEVINTAQWGGVLAILVLFLFLRNLKSTLIVGVAIPVSVLITFILMFFSDTTLNIMSLGGLALGIGMLVDNAIVVLESIFRCREEGDSIVEAARRGASEVGMAVTASTLTTIAVFFPIVFIEGVAGQIFTDQALTVTFALLASLAVALTFIPMMASREGGTGGAAGSGLWIQAAYREYRRSAPEERGRAWRWFPRKARKDTGAWFAGTFPGFAWFGETARGFRTRKDGGPSRAGWIFFYPVYLVGRFLVLAWRWLKGCVVQGHDSIRQEDGARWLRAARIAGAVPRWIAVFAFRFILPFFRLVRFLIGSFFKTLFTVVPNVLVLVLAPFWLLARAVFWLLGKIVRPVLNLFNHVLEKFQVLYVSVLSRALEHRFVTMVFVAALVATSAVLIPRLGTELIPELEQGEFAVDLILPTGTPLAATDTTATRIEDLIRDDPDIEQVYVVVGAVESGGTLVEEERENIARVTVMLQPETMRQQGSDDVMDRLRSRLADIPEARLEFVRPALFSFKAPLEVEIRGYNLQDLRSISGQVVDALEGAEGLRDARSLMEAGHPEVVVVFDRDRMAALGVDIGQAADAIRNKVRGSVATRFSAGDRKINILVRAREEDRKEIAQLKALAVNTGGRGNTNTENRPEGNPSGEDPGSTNGGSSQPAAERGAVLLSGVAQVRMDEGPSEIRRIDQQRVALVTANLTGIDLGSVARDIQNRLAGLPLPDDFSIDLGGQYREMNTASRSMLLAIAMAVFLVYLVMASQFESLLHPFIVMFSFLLALSGVLVTLYLLDITISVVVLIGIIMLAGIVVNNAIVLVDYINRLRRRGEDRINAVITAGRVRLRPILMTTATTVLGLLPLALGVGEGAEIRTPLAVTVIAGLISSTVLTLIVIPVVYTLLDRKQDAST
ncbi:MAG: efflux RND transporter permease subunit, partial [Gemmatimonadetes bacterium]|nr:efflux RND transporter permease subunit [Gemmatimonadota bacterium]